MAYEHNHEHPAKAIMAKRWEERTAEARARRIARLNLGDSGLITLNQLAGMVKGDETTPAAESSSVTAPAAAVSSEPVVAPVAVPPPRFLRDSRKAMLLVAVISHGVLLALLYFGGFLGR